MLQHKRGTSNNVRDMKKGIERGMKISRKKKEYLCAGGGRKQEGISNCRISMCQRVNTIKYLGSTVRDDDGKDIEVGRRMQLGMGGGKLQVGHATEGCQTG